MLTVGECCAIHARSALPHCRIAPLPHCPITRLRKWCRCRDLNPGHCGYEPHALTTELHRRTFYDTSLVSVKAKGIRQKAEVWNELTRVIGLQLPRRKMVGQRSRFLTFAFCLVPSALTSRRLQRRRQQRQHDLVMSRERVAAADAGDRPPHDVGLCAIETEEVEVHGREAVE